MKLHHPPLALSALLFFMFLGAALCGVAQVQISGEVSHNGQPLDQVTIRIYENGKYLRAIAANRKGRYQADLPYNHQYEFVFSRPYMIRVKILIDTGVEPSISASGNTYEVPFNMVMYHCYEELDVSACRKPIGVIRHAGRGEESFQFFPDTEVLRAVKTVNEASARMEKQGVEPVMDTEAHVSAKRLAGDENTYEEAVREPGIPPGDEAEAERARVEAARVRAMDMESERQEALERATALSSSTERDQQKKAAVAEEDRILAQWETMYANKELRASELEDAREARYRKVDRAVEADSLHARELEAAAAAYRREEVPVAEPLRRQVSEGWLYEEEALFVREDGKEVVYKFTEWDWGFFKTSYYYRNEHEIDNREFEKVRALFRE